MTFTEFNTATATDKATTLFKRGTTPDLVKDAEAAVVPGNTANEDDLEKKKSMQGTSENKNAAAAGPNVEEEKAKEAALVEQPKMTNVFSWDHLNYEVKTAGGTRKLLDDVSGFVAPGKLTALMGESGAGKVCFIPPYLCFIDVEMPVDGGVSSRRLY